MPWQKKLLKGCKAAEGANVHSLGGGGWGAGGVWARPGDAFIDASKSQLYLMSFPLLLAGAYISSILMDRGGGALNRNINYSEEQSCGGHIG